MDRLFYPVKRQNRAGAGAPAVRRRGFAGLGWRRGFTLIELIVVMIVIAILAVVVVPRFNLLKGYDEVGYRDKVKAALEFARKSAVSQRRYACAVIDASYDLTLTIETVTPENTAGTCPRTLALPAPDSSCGGGVTNKVCHPGAVTSMTTGSIRFDAQGKPVSGAGTYTINGDPTLAIKVEAETGYVH